MDRTDTATQTTAGPPVAPGAPMSVTDFLAGDHFCRADVLLCRGKKSLFSRLIRWATRSLFSHAALVFLTPSRDEGFEDVFLIESVTSGVDITNLRHYVVDHARDYDVAVLRFEAPWFGEDHAWLVRGVMLDFIKAEYDYNTVWQIAWSVLKRIAFSVETRISGLEKTLERRYAREKLAPGQFICSGFVQYGYYEAIDRYVRRGKLEPSRRSEVLFNRRLTEPPELAAMLATTPEDLAASPCLTWKYLISGGTVYSVGSRDEAHTLLRRLDRV